MSRDYSSTINTPHPTAARREEWGSVLDSTPAFELPQGGVRSRGVANDQFRCFSLHGMAVRYSADAYDLKWLIEFNARHRPAPGRGKTGASGAAPIQQTVSTATLEDAMTLLELLHFYRPAADIDQIHFPPFEGERIFGVPTTRIEKIPASILTWLRDYWVQKRKASNCPLIPSLCKGSLASWGDEHPDPFSQREWDCPVVVQEPLDVAEDIGLAEFDERLADAVTCGALRDNIAAVDTRLAVYSLAVARRAATGGSPRFTSSNVWDGVGRRAVESVLGL